MPRDPHLFAASYILLIQDGRILLPRRFQTGFEDGKYALPAGHVEPGENFTQALIREVQEEIGITLDKAQVRVAHVMHRKSPLFPEREYVDVLYTADQFTGTPENKEPEKCDELAWFPPDDLPENTVSYVRQAIENWQKGIPYSEFGW